MIYAGSILKFPGRSYELRHVDLDGWFAVALASIPAISELVEPTVVEALIGDVGEPQVIQHLVANDADGGAYTRVPEGTTSVRAIEAPSLAAWIRAITHDGENPIATLSITTGWYAVDANPGDVIRLNEGAGVHEITVVHSGRACVPGPTGNVLVAPVEINLDSITGTLRFAVQWSPWSDVGGIGHSRFDDVRRQLEMVRWTA